MPKEINLFEQELEFAIQEENVLPLQVAQKTQKEPENSEETKQPQHVQIKQIIEALLFASSDPIPFTKIREITDTIQPLSPRVLRAIIQELQDEYRRLERAFCLEEIAQGFLLRSRKEYSPYIELLYRNKRSEKLSQASAEVLAIIAYRQPITRPQIEAIRGVDCSGIVYNLLERQLITPLGKLEAPGRPTLFGITKDFLKHFGLRDVKDLPVLDGETELEKTDKIK